MLQVQMAEVESVDSIYGSLRSLVEAMMDIQSINNNPQSAAIKSFILSTMKTLWDQETMIFQMILEARYKRKQILKTKKQQKLEDMKEQVHELKNEPVLSALVAREVHQQIASASSSFSSSSSSSSARAAAASAS